MAAAAPEGAQEAPAEQQTAPPMLTEAKPQIPPADRQAPAISAPAIPAPAIPAPIYRAASSDRSATAPPSRRPLRFASASFAVVSATVNLRGRPATDSEVITTIRAGSTVRVADCSSAWCVVAWDKYSGYAVARNLNLGASGQARAYPAQPRYRDDYELEPPVLAYGQGPPGYYAPPAVVYGHAYYPAYYYVPRVYYGSGWTSPATTNFEAQREDNQEARSENAFARFFNRFKRLLPGHAPEEPQ
jgi:uncharacterized protein YgiM (DUF1202 family)